MEFRVLKLKMKKGFYNEDEMVNRYLQGRDRHYVFGDTVTASSTFSEVMSRLSHEREREQKQPIKPSLEKKDVETTLEKLYVKPTPAEKLEQALPPPEKPMELRLQPKLHYSYTPPPRQPSRHQVPVRSREPKTKRGRGIIIISQKVVQIVQ